jgi:diacylglycerol kinase (ATP)
MSHQVMNNYVGIGIDAKVAVEFHEIRDNYPSFFQSQVCFHNPMAALFVQFCLIQVKRLHETLCQLILNCMYVPMYVPSDALRCLQFGNKMWYTGVGLQDLVRRSCVGLHKRLKLECDGVEVPLPPDAEGLVVLNIGCHMVSETNIGCHMMSQREARDC